MVEAALGLAIGGVLGRWVLWPFEMHLAARHIRLVQVRADRLRAEIDSATHSKEVNDQ